MGSFTAGHLPKNVRVPLTSRDDVTRIGQQLQSEETYQQLVISGFFASYLCVIVPLFLCCSQTCVVLNIVLGRVIRAVCAATAS